MEKIIELKKTMLKMAYQLQVFIMEDLKND